MTIKKLKAGTKWAALACSLAVISAQAQTSQPLFSDDFESGALDPAKWRQDNRPFESGTSDIQPIVSGGVLEFSGTVTEQWWPGSAIATVPTFSASMETNLVLTVDRLAELGFGTASRSAIWITDTNRENFVVFADVRGEGGWRYNRKINLNGDSPNGSGVDMAVFNDPLYDDGGFHRMKVVANGETVKLYLDDILGAEVAFPYKEGIVFQLGSYARANNDTAYTQFDNFQVAAVGAVSFAQKSIEVRPNQTSSEVTVRIPNGANATQSVQVQVISADPAIATPVGAQNGVLTLTFAPGASTSQTFKVQGVKSGGTTFTFQNDRDLLMANTLAVNVLFPIGTVLEDTFSSTLDSTKWEVSNRGFESGIGDFTVATSNGQLNIAGTLTAQYWGGAGVRTVESYSASRDLELVFEVDRTSMERTGTAARSAIFITSADRSRFVAFSQNHGENGWTANVNPGNPTGGGTTLTALNTRNDLGAHKMKLVANGETVSVYLDGVLGGTFPFAVTTGIKFEISAHARANNDTVSANFDNARISTALPCTDVVPGDVTTEAGINTNSFAVIIPRLLNESASASVTVTSRDPSVAVPTGATSGSLKLNFPVGATNRQVVAVTALKPGITTFDIVDDQGGCVVRPVSVTVTPALLTLLADDFAAAITDTSRWTINEQSFNTGVLTNSTVTQTGGQVQFHVTPGSEDWPGITYKTADAYNSSLTEPLIFEVDRLSHVGTGASTRTGVWISDATRQNYVFFSYDDNNKGWQFNRRINQAGDNPVAAEGTNIAAFDAPEFNGGNRHRLKVVANGQTAKFYLDNVLGAEVPFPFTNGIHFEFGAFARSVRDVVDASFDNALLRGPMPCITTDVTQLELAAGAANQSVSVSIPRLLNATAPAQVTVTSSKPSVATPVGGSNGALTLTFPAGSTAPQTFQVQRGTSGLATLSFSTAGGLCSVSDVTVTSLAMPQELLTDTFTSPTLDATKWVVDPTPFETGAVDPVVVTGSGMLEISVSAISNYWGGYGVITKESFYAGAADPVTFEIDRSYIADNGSTGARSAVWILDATGTNYVMFADLHESGRGWTYNRKIAQNGDNPTGGGINMPALDGAAFDDSANHRLKLVANGSTVKFYVDGVLGAEVAFPFSTGLKFRVGSYARAEFDYVVSAFANASITGSNAPVDGGELDIAKNGAQVTISWEGSATLEETTDITGGWTTVTGATSPYNVTPNGTKFYRLRR